MNTINAQEARAITDTFSKPLEDIFSQIQSQCKDGYDYTYAVINKDTKAELFKLGYTITPSSQPNESRISW